MLKRCEWCGRTFTCERSSARFCSGLCRKRHNRAYRDGTRLKLPKEPPSMPDATVSEDDIARAVVGTRGMAAFYDVAAENGPSNRSELCRHMSMRIVAALEEVGL